MSDTIVGTISITIFLVGVYPSLWRDVTSLSVVLLQKIREISLIGQKSQILTLPYNSQTLQKVSLDTL